MIGTLRVRFLAAAMAALFIVLALIGSGWAILSYRQLEQEADATLELLLENEGAFPETFSVPREQHGRGMSEETPFESRFFSVILSESGEALAVDTGRIAAVDQEEAVEYAAAAVLKGKERGFLGSYRYGIQFLAGGEARIVFLDCRRLLSHFKNFCSTFCWVAAVGMAAVCALLAYFSGRVVRPLAESYEKQKRFITDAGHELKTPLAIIDADAEVLSLERGESEWIADIKSQTSRLLELTNDLICLSRMEEGEKQAFSQISLSAEAETAVQTFQTAAKAQGKTLRTQIQPEVHIKGDEKMIRRLLSVLLDNALKYSPSQGEIVVTVEKRARGAAFSVWNTAEKVNKKDLEHLFDRFYRADPSRNSGTGGHGIGLSIAKAVMTAHKGKIWASTEDGHSLLIRGVFPG